MDVLWASGQVRWRAFVWVWGTSRRVRHVNCKSCRHSLANSHSLDNDSNHHQLLMRLQTPPTRAGCCSTPLRISSSSVVVSSAEEIEGTMRRILATPWMGGKKRRIGSELCRRQKEWLSRRGRIWMLAMKYVCAEERETKANVVWRLCFNGCRGAAWLCRRDTGSRWCPGNIYKVVNERFQTERWKWDLIELSIKRLLFRWWGRRGPGSWACCLFAH